MTALEVLRNMMIRMDAVEAELHEEGDVLVLRLGMPYNMSGFTHGNTYTGTIVNAEASSSPIMGEQIDLTLRIMLHG